MPSLPETESHQAPFLGQMPDLAPEQGSDASQAFAQRFLMIFDDASYSAIARRLDTNHATIIPYAKGTRFPTGEMLLRIQRVTGVNLHWLLTGNGPRRVSPVQPMFTGDQERAIVKMASAAGRTFDEQVAALASAALELTRNV